MVPGKFDELPDIVFENNPREVQKSKIKDQLAMRILNKWELEYARGREHQMMTRHTLLAVLQPLATDLGIYFTVLVPQHSRLIAPVRMKYPLHGRSLATS